MTTYTATFRTDIGEAEETIKAKSPAHALTKARRLAADDYDDLLFTAYEGQFPVNQVSVFEADGCTELAVWRDADLHLRLAAADLLAAAKDVIASWEKGDLARAVRGLAEAVAMAEGGAS